LGESARAQLRPEQAEAVATQLLVWPDGRSSSRPRPVERLRAAVRRGVAEGEVGLVADGGDDRVQAGAHGADEVVRR
jgi:hypothetical protein